MPTKLNGWTVRPADVGTVPRLLGSQLLAGKLSRMKRPFMKLEMVTVSADQSAKQSEILFIHGVYHSAWCWENFQPYFAEHGYTNHAISLRGHGSSDGAEALAKASFRDYLEDVTSVFDGFDEAPIVIGHSLGGMLIQKLIEQRTVPAAVLVSTPTPKTLRMAGLKLVKKYPTNILRFLITLNPDHIYKDRALVRALFFSPGRTDEDLARHLIRLLSEGESRRIFLDVMFQRFTKPFDPVPVLIIGGGEDYTLGIGNFEETARIYDTQPIVLDGLPHDLMLDPRWEDAAGRIVEWLSSN